MSVTGSSLCTVHYVDGPCMNVAASGVPVCGPCLGALLDEPDPGRRRALATLESLPTGVLLRLIDDPDAGVRARVAIRDDLDAGTIARLADPDREHSPIVWRAVASTPGGASHAASLINTNDPLTLMVLATNPATNQGLLDQLVGHADAEVARVAVNVRDRQPLDAAIAQSVLDAQAVPTTPIDTPPENTHRPGAEPHPPEPPGSDLGNAGPDSSPDRRVRFAAIIVAMVVIAVCVAAAFLWQRGSSPNHAATLAPTSVAVGPKPSTPATSAPSTTVTATTEAPTTTAAGPPLAAVPIALDITVTAQQKRFCNTVELRIVYHARSADAAVNDDVGHELWRGYWPSGATKTIKLAQPTRHLQVHLTSRGDPDAFQPSGSVKGGFC